MLTAFKTILVPVDFTENTEVAISRSLSLAGPGPATLYLLHVFRSTPFVNNTAAYEARIEKLSQWKASVEESREGITVICQLKESSLLQPVIRQTASELKPDIIVIGQSAKHAGLFSFRKISPMRLANTSGVPVLTVKPGSLSYKTKTVVVPVGDTFPQSKMQALAVLCRQAKPNIHLITFVDGNCAPSEFSATLLLQIYQWLKNSLHCPVDYAVVHGSNKAKAILRYAENNGADILLVQPEKETKIGWGDCHISDVLPRESRMQVLAVGAAP